MGVEIIKLEGKHFVCTIKNEKGDICSGHLKEYMTAPDSVRKQVTQGFKLYRCKRCKTIYASPPQEHLHASKEDEVIPPQNVEVGG
jgi:hypothetical protein